MDYLTQILFHRCPSLTRIASLEHSHIFHRVHKHLLESRATSHPQLNRLPKYPPLKGGLLSAFRLTKLPLSHQRPTLHPVPLPTIDQSVPDNGGTYNGPEIRRFHLICSDLLRLEKTEAQSLY